MTPRQPYDYPEAVRLEVLCGECAGGDFAESCYYDRADNHITRDPDDVRLVYARQGPPPLGI